MNRLKSLLIKYSQLHIFIVAVSLVGIAQIPVDYTSVVAYNVSASYSPTHYAYGTHGPVTAFNKIWVFYSDGEYAVWRTKQIDSGGGWNEGGNVFDSENARYFNMTFDGEYFHFIRAMNGELKYLRGKAFPDGSIQFSAEVTAYSDPVWKVYHMQNPESYPKPRHFAIATDREQKPWVILKVSDSDGRNANFKPIALSSIGSDGTWVSRPGLPSDLAVSYKSHANGRAVTVTELDVHKILFTWGNYRTISSDPEREFQARLWDISTLGPIEKTGLTWHTSATSIVVPEPGIAILNSQTEVARRNADGSWTRIDPGEMNNWSFNSLSSFNNRVRIWDYSNGSLRYKETEDNGNSWSSVIQKWQVGNIHFFSASGYAGSQGRHHSLLWSEGNNPYDIVMAIEGEYEMYYHIPTVFTLDQNYPNPFNPVTTIRFALETEVAVRVEIYNILGQHITTLIDGVQYRPGTYEATWDARDASGRIVPSGIYIYRIIAGDFIETKKMTLMK